MADASFLLASIVPSSGMAVAAASLLALFLLLRPSRAQAPVASLPQPPSALPFLGITLDVMFKYRHSLPTYFLNECLRFQGKPYVLNILTKIPMVMLYNVRVVEDVLKTQFHKFGKGPVYIETQRDVFGRGIFASDGPAWQHQRKFASFILSGPVIRDIMNTAMAEHTEQLCGIVANAAQASKPIDMKHLLELFATDVFTKICFGVDLQFMIKDNQEFFDRFARANKNLLYRQEQPTSLWKLKQWLGVGAERQQTKDVAWLDNFVYGVIQDSVARRNKAGEAEGEEAKPNLVTLLLDARSSEQGAEEVGGEVDMQEIRDMAMTFISAGRDTTAFSMSWFMVMMARFPDEQKRIRQELQEKLPQLMSGEIQSPSRDQISQLTYLEAAIKENLRLNPVIHVNLRETLEDVELIDGTFLATGTQVLIPVYAMARLPSIWGPDAAEFKPERWIDPATGKLEFISPFKFTTFSGGPRMCPGEQFSMTEMKIALAALLSKFEFMTVKDPEKFEYETSLTLGIHGPVMMHVKPLSPSKATRVASH